MKLGSLRLALIAGYALAVSTSAADAYVGPGAGLSAIGSLFSVLAALLFAVMGFIWYPLKRLFTSGRSATPGSFGRANPADPAER